MKVAIYQALNVWKEDYQRLVARKVLRPGMSLAGLFHEALDKSEPKIRNTNGKFAKTEEESDATRTLDS